MRPRVVHYQLPWVSPVPLRHIYWRIDQPQHWWKLVRRDTSRTFNAPKLSASSRSLPPDMNCSDKTTPVSSLCNSIMAPETLRCLTRDDCCRGSSHYYAPLVDYLGTTRILSGHQGPEYSPTVLECTAFGGSLPW